MKLETNLDVIKKLGQEREEENIKFRFFLKWREEDDVDEIVHRLHDEIAAQIDCTLCGNCCKMLRPFVSDEELKRLSEIDNITPEAFDKKYVELSDEEMKYLKEMPCKYLKDNKCTVYIDRPSECRSYPHTHKDEFTTRLLGVINNYEICPIVFNLYEQLKREMGFRY